MAADFRNVILANEEENKKLVSALREADSLIASLRYRVSELQSELDALKESPATQEQIDALTLASQKRVLVLDQWLSQTVRQ